MYSFSSLSSSSLLRANIRQNISLIFVSEVTTSRGIRFFRRYSYFFSSFLAFFAFLPTSSYANETIVQKEFIVTAYYSPLPNQSWYSKWTFEAEKRLNGEGTHGASGKPVFMGMIAAPKTYEFGTRIDFEGLWVGIVEDRGGAIVNAWERGQTADRIDIWMGYGESGLVRARSWGKRRVIGTITTDTTKPFLNFQDIDTGKVNMSAFGTVWPTSSNYISEEVLLMFGDLGYDNTTRDVRGMIIEFQKDHGIIDTSKDEGAGVYGPKTKAALAKEHTRYLEIRDIEMKKIEAEKNLLLSAKTEWENSYQVAAIKVNTIGTPKRGESGQHIAELQKALKIKWYYKGRMTGTMNISTILAIKSLQRGYGIKQTGAIDDPTREVLVAMIAESV